MGFWTGTTKSTQTTRPTIAVNKKLTSAEFNTLTGLLNINYQELLDLAVLVAGLSPLPEVEKDIDFTISSSGIYTFFGSTPRTFQIDDTISGEVQIRTIATADLTLIGNINSNHMKTIYQGSAFSSFRWNATAGEYTF